MPGKESSFLAAVPSGMLERCDTMRVRGSRAGNSRWRDSPRRRWSSGGGGRRAAARRPGTPVALGAHWAADIDPADVSQDAPAYVIGERVRHRTFGSGTIAEVSGGGRDAKVKIDFEDTAIGRKTLVIAQAGLQRALE